MLHPPQIAAHDLTHPAGKPGAAIQTGLLRRPAAHALCSNLRLVQSANAPVRAFDIF